MTNIDYSNFAKVEPYTIKDVRKNIRLDRQALRARITQVNAAMKSGNTGEQLHYVMALVEIADLLRADLQELHDIEEGEN
jgi:hypothetical protein